VLNNKPLLGILDKFQDGCSHTAIVSRFSIERAKSFKKASRQSLTQRIRQTVGISDDSGSSRENEDGENANEAGASKPDYRKNTTSDGSVGRGAILRGNPTSENDRGEHHSDGEVSEPDVAKR
jgi:metal transporter CNNM